jgi:threonine/homoserine/homoserine lactone efflux protein
MFLKGIAIGFSIAAPVGPIGLLCIRRSLAEGILAGLMTGLGAATADAAYGCVAGFGLTAVSRLLVRQQFWLGLFGGIFLCYLGGRILTSKPPKESAQLGCGSLLSAYASTLLLTLANPLTIISFAAVFAGFGLGSASSSDYFAASLLVAGVFMGSAIWWLFLCSGVATFRRNMSASTLRGINYFSGCLLLGFGLAAVTRQLMH